MTEEEAKVIVRGCTPAIREQIAARMAEFETTMKAFTDAATDSVAKLIADVKREAERSEQLRATEFRAWFAERKLEALENKMVSGQ